MNVNIIFKRSTAKFLKFSFLILAIIRADKVESDGK